MEGTSLLRYKGSGCHIQIIRLGGKCLTVSNFFFSLYGAKNRLQASHGLAMSTLFFFFEIGFSLAWNLTSGLDWLTRKPLGPSCLQCSQC